MTIEGTNNRIIEKINGIKKIAEMAINTNPNIPKPFNPFLILSLIEFKLFI